MPYLEYSTPVTPSIPSTNNDMPSVIIVSNMPDYSVFASGPSPETSSSVSSPETPVPIPRRSTRSTKGKPPERYGNIYTFDTIVDMGSHSQCPCDYCHDRLCIIYYVLILVFLRLLLNCISLCLIDISHLNSGCIHV